MTPKISTIATASSGGTSESSGVIISPMPKPEYPRTTAQSAVTTAAKTKIQSIGRAAQAPFSQLPASVWRQ